MIGLETEEDSATVVLENQRLDVRVNGDEAGNDGAAARRCTIVRFEFTLTEFLKSHIHVCPHVLTSIQRDVCSLSILIVFFFFPIHLVHPSRRASLSYNLFRYTNFISRKTYEAIILLSSFPFFHLHDSLIRIRKIRFVRFFLTTILTIHLSSSNPFVARNATVS